jgi:hypothetical protein
MTNGSPTKPNFFTLLGLDPDAAWDPARFKRVLGEKTDQWTRQSNGIATSATTRAARQYLRLLPEIEAVMADPAQRGAQAEAGRKDRAAAIVKRRLELEERLEIVLQKGYVFDTERAAIEKHYPDHRDLLAGRSLGRRLEAAETRPEGPGVRRRERLESVTAQNVRAALEVLSLESLYEVLHTVDPAVTEASELPELRAAADKLYQQAHRTMDKSPEVGARQQLAGFAKTIFADEDKRRRYDTSLSLQPLDDLIQQFDQALLPVARVEASQVELLLDRAQERGIDPDEALIEVADHFGRRKKTVELPRAAAEALRTKVPCWNCGGANDPTDAAEARCALCQVLLWTACPRCRAKVPGGAVQCGRCGLQVWRRGYVAVMVEDLEEALRRRDVGSAGAKLAAARREWNLPADNQDELAARIRKARAQLQELEQEERRSTAKLTATVAAMLSEHRYQSARSALLAAPPTLPDRERLLAETLGRIGEANALYQQAMQSGTGNERRADLLAMALRVCADHDPARTALAEIPPPPPLDLRAVPSASGDIVHLTWRRPVADQVAFVVVRKAGSRPPVSPHDGTRVATVTEPSCDDPSPEPGVPLWYAVFSDRVGGPAASEAATLARPVVLVPEVADLRLTADAGSVTGSWRAHPRARQVMVTRRQLQPPRTPDDGDPVGPVTLVGFVDSQVRTGTTYHYRVSAVYATPQGQRYVSSGVVASATPALPATAVNDLEVAERLLDNGMAVDAVWTPPAGGAVSIHLSDVPPAWPRGATVPPAELAVFARPLPGVPEPLADRRVRLPVPPVHGRRFLTAATVGGNGAVIGNTVELDLLEPVGGLTAERLDDVVRLSWVWPAHSTAARVRWWPVGRPGAVLGERRCLRHVYAEEGGFQASVGTWAVTVSVQALLDERTGGLGSAPALLDVPALATVVRYSIRRGGFTRRGRATVVLSATAACELPELLVVQRAGAIMPLGAGDGEVIARVPAQTLRPESPLSVELSLRAVRGPSWLACFPVAGSGAEVTLVPPPVSQLKVS